VENGTHWQGHVWKGRRGEESSRVVRSGLARLGMVWQARLGSVGCCWARQRRSGVVAYGGEWLGEASRGR